MLVDSHCHLDFPDFQSRLPEVLAAASAAGIGRMVTISTHVARFETYRALAEAHKSIFCTVGTHPHNAAAEPDVPAERLIELSTHPRCVAVGEAGLDYHYDKSPRDVQQRVFRTHIAAARETGAPSGLPPVAPPHRSAPPTPDSDDAPPSGLPRRDGRSAS